MKITKAKVQKIIAEEYQRIIQEQGLPQPNEEKNPESEDSDVRNRSELAMIFKKDIAPIILKASGITGPEPQILKDLVAFVIKVLDVKSVNPRKADTIKNKIIQTVGQVQEGS